MWNEWTTAFLGWGLAISDQPGVGNSAQSFQPERHVDRHWANCGILDQVKSALPFFWNHFVGALFWSQVKMDLKMGQVYNGCSDWEMSKAFEKCQHWTWALDFLATPEEWCAVRVQLGWFRSLDHALLYDPNLHPKIKITTILPRYHCQTTS